MAKPQGVPAALDRLRELFDEETELDTTAYELRAEAREYTRRDPAYVERILARLDRIDTERERVRLERRKLMREKIEPALDHPSKRTEDSLDELRQALIACMARSVELEKRIAALEERKSDSPHTYLERIK